MSMSDAGWQAWLPEDLLGEAISQEQCFQSTKGVTGDVPLDAEYQAELNRLRHQAEEKGLSQGRAKGAEEGRKQGYDEGYLQGCEEGIAQGKAESQAQLQLQLAGLSRLMEGFQDALDNLDSVIPSRLMQIALMAARSVLGEHSISDGFNSLVLTRVRQLLDDDALLKGELRVWISADEPAETRQQLETLLASYHWELCTDPHLLAGGCRISTVEGELDASVETRWQSLCHLIQTEEGK